MHDRTNITIEAGAYRYPLTNRPGQFVTVCPIGRDFIRDNNINSLFISLDGSRKYGYVSHYAGDVAGEMATLARGITGAGKGQRVRYIDGDVLNLRLSNLQVERGAAKGQSPNPRRPGSDL